MRRNEIFQNFFFFKKFFSLRPVRRTNLNLNEFLDVFNVTEETLTSARTMAAFEVVAATDAARQQSRGSPLVRGIATEERSNIWPAEVEACMQGEEIEEDKAYTRNYPGSGQWRGEETRPSVRKARSYGT